MTQPTPPPWSRSLVYLFGAGLIASAVAWVAALGWALIQHGRLEWVLVQDPFFMLILVYLVPGAFLLTGATFRRRSKDAPPPPVEFGWWDHLARVGAGWFFVIAGVVCMVELFVVDYLMH